MERIGWGGSYSPVILSYVCVSFVSMILLVDEVAYNKLQRDIIINKKSRQIRLGSLSGSHAVDKKSNKPNHGQRHEPREVRNMRIIISMWRGGGEGTGPRR